MNTPLVRNVLSIAGSDPSGGAGIQADLKTFAALGVYGAAAITALAAQNTRHVTRVFPVPYDIVAAQLDALFSDVRIDAVKIGMLGSVETVHVVAAALREYRPPFVVLDPVMRASTGSLLLDHSALSTLVDTLLPLVTVVTPNLAEAVTLLGVAMSGGDTSGVAIPGGAILGGAIPDAALPRTIDDAHAVAAALTRYAPAVLVTGGHGADARYCIDVLHDQSNTQEFRVARRPEQTMHGTGCVLSSAIAALLAQGMALRLACERAQRFVASAIAYGPLLSVGHGAGPVHALGELWERRDV